MKRTVCDIARIFRSHRDADEDKRAGAESASSLDLEDSDEDEKKIKELRSRRQKIIQEMEKRAGSEVNDRMSE